MITFATTRAHAYTVAALGEDFGASLPPCRAMPYDELFGLPALPGGTYVFCDIERLSHQELVLAAELHRKLKGAQGFRVLNDPGRIRTRYGLLRGLREAGVNRFDAYRADGLPKPGAFPVFVRAEAVHEEALTGLLGSQAELEAELRRLADEGHALRGLVVIEYCAEPVSPGIFQRWGSFRIGDRIHLDHIVMEDSWNVKWGTAGLATEETFAAHDRAVRENAHADALAAAFGVSGIEYGRADFGLVAGLPQIYEINTNPFVTRLSEHRSATRMATMLFSHQRFAECLAQIDTPDCGASLTIDPSCLSERARRAYDELAEPRVHALREAEARAVGPDEVPPVPDGRDAEIGALRIEAERLRAEAAELRGRVEALHLSRSWRLTGPLRTVTTAVRARRRPVAVAPRRASVAICMLRDAVDLVPFLCGHYLRIGLDEIRFIDDGSTDGTYEWLDAISRRDARIHVRRAPPDDTVRQSREMTRTANAAIADGFRLILPFDCDEFWNLRREDVDTLLSVRSPRVVRGQWVNFAQRRSAGKKSPGSLFGLQYRVPQTPLSLVEVGGFREPFIAHLDHKVAVMTDGPIRLTSGQHALDAGPADVESRGFEIFHLPLRHRSELANRASLEARRVGNRDHGLDSWQSMFHAEAVREGRTDEVWAANSVDRQGYLDVYGQRRPTIRDRRLSHALWAASLYMLRRHGLVVV